MGKERGTRRSSQQGTQGRRRLGEGGSRRTADGGLRCFAVRRLRLPSREQERNWSGGSRGRARGGSAPIYRGRGAEGDAPTSPVVGGGCCSAGRGRLPSRAGNGAAPTGGPGWQRLRAPGRLGGGCWRLCWAERGGDGLAAGAGPSEEKGEASWAGAERGEGSWAGGCQGIARGPKTRKGRRCSFSFLFSKQIFPKAFSNIFLKSFEL